MTKLKLFLQTSSQLVVSCGIILGCLLIAKLTMHFIGGSFPAPILGMLLLVTLLLSGIIKEAQVIPFASPLLNFMPLFFIPAGVGFIEHLGLIQQYWQFITATLILIPLTSLLLISHIIGYYKGRAQHD
ncbi:MULTISPECIES: CidA/LrgA family protein [unclassified Pseudoalteromonas]|uniref:CidA/LrgA family protein n=1 Tax=unclassified Pseudoalteromonas TaxID=194690 RepID=UPI0025B45757|nr:MULTISPECIES: CidA/LrgA family protein [unclassified Pseudoalteromonas]MDN3376865.1 CidA/LrgA family protein [Pseudoalteromonas sp. APC 3893]MDN3387425.1 CidA/LrgA family protein [Pseudoalteromonas sp. APC 4017]